MARPLPRAVAARPGPTRLPRQAFSYLPPTNVAFTSSRDGDDDEHRFGSSSSSAAAAPSFTSMPYAAVGNGTWQLIGHTRGTPIFSGDALAVGPQTNTYIFVYPDSYSSVITPGAQPSTRPLFAAAQDQQTSLSGGGGVNGTASASNAPTASSAHSEAAPAQPHSKAGAVAGALIGVLLLLAGCVAVFLLLRRRRRRRSQRAERDFSAQRDTPMAEKHDGLSSRSSRRSMHLASRPTSLLSMPSRSSLHGARPLSPAQNPFDDPSGLNPFGEEDSAASMRSPSMLSLAQSQDSQYAPSMATVSSSSRPIRSEGPYPLPPRTPLAPSRWRSKRAIDPRVHADLLDAHGELDVDYARASFSTDVSRAMWVAASQSGASSSRGSLRTSASGSTSLRERDADEADASSARSFVRSRPNSWRSLSTNEEAEMWQQRAAAAARRASSQAESIRSDASAAAAAVSQSTSRPRLAINTSSHSIKHADPFADSTDVDADGDAGATGSSGSSSSQGRTLTSATQLVKKADQSTLEVPNQPPALHVIAPTPSTRTHSAVDAADEETLPGYSAWR